MMRKGLLTLVLVVGACSSDPGNVLDPPPPDGGQQLASTPFTLKGGEEKYFCWTFRSPDEATAITKVQPITGTLVHHLVLFQTVTTSPEPDGFFECPQLVRLNWRPIWAEGTGGHALELPDGVGFQIAPKTQYLVQVHLLNATDAEVTERVGMNLTYAKDPSAIQPAGIFALGSFNIDIPPDESDYKLNVQCDAASEVHAFAAFPHMHQIGSKLEMTSNDQPVYHIDPWVFGDQPMDPIDVTIHKGDHLSATCHWNNKTGHEVKFGESSNDEMCFMVLFAYPLTQPDGCIQ